jgi:acetate---CoA ligase (ADP-forming)
MRNFLQPESVVMIGAPRKTGPDTYNGVEMMLLYGYKGRIYPINPKADEICGIKAYPSVTDVPEVADLAIISIGRDNVVAAFKECIQAGITSVIVISQGFSDADEHGNKLQEEIVGLARRNGVRVLGPNTMGSLNNFRNFSTSFVDLPIPEKVPPVSLVAQTGVIQVGYQDFAYQSWGKALDIGNGCDVDFVDALEYFGNDPETRIIVLHMEGVLRGREFLKVASRVSFKKPIIVFKTGRSAAAAKAALSHTGSLVGENEVNNAAFDRAGIISVKNIHELRDAIRALLRLGEMAGPRLGVITATGAGGIMATDACDDYGLTIGSLPDGLAEKLRKGMPDWVHVGNPIDIWPIGMIGGNYPEAYKTAMKELLTASEVDGVLSIAPHFNSPLHPAIYVFEAARAAREKAGNMKPVAMWFYMDSAAAEKEMEAIDGFACFGSIEQAVQGLSFCYQYHRIKRRKLPRQRRFEYNSEPVKALLLKGRKQKALLGEDALALLGAFGIPIVKGKAARSWGEIEKAADAMNYPVVLKLSGEAFLHKSEWGGVTAGIRNKKELRDAFKRIKESVRRRNPEVKIAFQIQEQATGKELLLGLKNDPNFGLVLACGLGGIYTEVFKDISRELVPIGRREAEKMLSSLKSYPLLTGVRGETGADMEELLDAMERLSFMATKVPDIAELDINPLMAGAQGCRAVDARILF